MLVQLLGYQQLKIYLPKVIRLIGLQRFFTFIVYIIQNRLLTLYKMKITKLFKANGIVKNYLLSNMIKSI